MTASGFVDQDGDFIAPWEQDFLARLCQSGVVSDAARTAGVTRQTVYFHQKRSQRFADAWKDAVEQANDGLRLEARRRAVEGYDKPIFYQGVQVAIVREYSDQLLMFIMRGNMPEQYRTNVDMTSKGDRVVGPVIYMPEIKEEPTEEDTDDSSDSVDSTIE